VPLHTATVAAARRPRLGLIAAVVAVSVAAGAGTVVIAGNEAAPQIDTSAGPSRAAATRYFDIEANKARTMRELGLHMPSRAPTRPRATTTSRPTRPAASARAERARARNQSRG
jgi:hypothetical protein